MWHATINVHLVMACSGTYITTLFSECTFTLSGTSYAGSVAETDLGRPCLRWDSVTSNPWSAGILYPEGSLEGAGNFCRNPNQRAYGPWCFYGDDADQWEYCNVPRCGER